MSTITESVNNESTGHYLSTFKTAIKILKTKRIMDKTKSSKMMDLLDSDDEFPMEYFEEVITPAYKNDHRFEMIQFKWISEPPVPAESKINKNLREIRRKYINPPVKRNGILSRNDLFCLKSLEGYGDSTLIWFVNFLIHKDLQSNYIFLRSCLVNKYHCDEVLNPNYIEHCNETTNLYTVKY